MRRAMGWDGEAEVDVYEAPDGTIAIAPLVDGHPRLLTTKDGWTVLTGLGHTVTDDDVQAALNDLRS